MASLTLAQAEARSALHEVTRTDIELDLTREDRFRSTTRLEFTCAKPGSSSFVNFRGVELISATLNGVTLDPAAWSEGRLSLDHLALTNQLVVDGWMAYSNDGEGLVRIVDPADGAVYLYAMSFLDAAPRWFACFDQPDLKTIVNVRVRHREEWTVVGNGPAIIEEPGITRIEASHPLPTYLVTLAAGPWLTLTDEHDGIPLFVHSRMSLADFATAEAPDIFRVTAQGFDAYHDFFASRYPFGEYHQVFVPDFNAGAMENPGCVLLRDEMLFRGAATHFERAGRAGTVLHEMAHMWFGDIVTMRWWDDLWLNESFAEYMGHRMCSEHTGYDLWTEFGINRKNWGLVADSSPSSHPVAGNGAPDTVTALQQFDAISYSKGASVLRQLVARIGDDVFRAGLRDYLSRHAFGNATRDDLLAAWERAGAEDLPAWFDAWLGTIGADRLVVRSKTIAVEAPEEHPARRAHAIDVASLGPDGALLGTQRVVACGETIVDLPDGCLIPDASDLTWGSARFDGGWATLPPTSKVADPLTRCVIYRSLADGVRRAELDPRWAWDYLAHELVAEPSDELLRGMLHFAASELGGGVTPPEYRASVLDDVARVAREVIDAAPPAGDRQLAAFRAWLSTTHDADALTSLLCGQLEVEGRPLDAPLRWMALQRLAQVGADHGRVAEAIERELASDRSSTGVSSAARAYASIPTLAAKEAAFNDVLTATTLGPAELRATAMGIFDPEQHELVRPLALRYFREINRSSFVREGWLLAIAAQMAFPVAISDPDVLEAAEDLLASDDLHPQLRRVVVDGTHQLRRGVAARASFSSE